MCQTTSLPVQKLRYVPPQSFSIRDKALCAELFSEITDIYTSDTYMLRPTSHRRNNISVSVFGAVRENFLLLKGCLSSNFLDSFIYSTTILILLLGCLSSKVFGFLHLLNYPISIRSTLHLLNYHVHIR